MTPKWTKKLCLLLSLVAPAFAHDALAQSCVKATCTAASPAPADILAALPSSSNPNATVVVKIPPGIASWTSPLDYTVPSSVTNLTIEGATTVGFTGTAGTSSYAYSINDATVIQDAFQSNEPLIDITTGGASSVFRITGLTIEGGNVGSSSWTKYSGMVDFSGASQSFRLDHIHFDVTTYNPATNTSFVRVLGGVFGVLDHNVVDLGTNTSVANGFQAFDAIDDIGYGDGPWAAATPWGSKLTLFMESNYYKGGAPNDCADGASFVMRYNTIDSAYVGIQSHGTKTPAGGTRGCRSYEAYHNYFTGPTAAPASGAVGSKGNSQLIWGNTLAQGAYRFYESSTDRSSGAEVETNTPNGWGYCGTATNGNGVGSPWDGNQSASTGYPCLDGLGRGQAPQPLNGKYWPNRLNAVTGTIAWPHQYLEPIYMWNNSVGSATYVLIQDSVTQNNRDYYFDCGAANSGCSGAFTGAAGTGYGPLASRPTTCTAGPGGTYFTSPTGSYGVAYFATDANGGQGELYVCTSKDTWTPIYQPFTYPHPLVSGSSVTATLPAAPTGLVAVVK